MLTVAVQWFIALAVVLVALSCGGIFAWLSISGLERITSPIIATIVLVVILTSFTALIKNILFDAE